MKHLTDIELVDLLDGALPPSRVGHVAHCPECSARTDAMRAAAAAAAETAADEPSPLFWDAFPARVAAAIDAAPAVAWWRRPVFAALAGVAALVVAVFAVLALLREPAGTRPAPVVSMTPDAVTTPIEEDVEQDAAWAVVRTAAEDLDYDDALAAGLSARPGDAERAAMELSDSERAELLRILEREMKRAGA
jgi:hypothetical protein